MERSKQCKCDVFMMGNIFVVEKEMRQVIADINIKKSLMLTLTSDLPNVVPYCSAFHLNHFLINA